MNSKDLALGNLEDAEARLAMAEAALRSSKHHIAVRMSQEAVELALKAALRYVNVDPPRVHDVGVVLRRHADRFPPSFAAEVATLARISRQLRGERERSMYGDEDTGLPLREIYTQADGQQALQDAQRVVGLCARLVKAGS